MSDFEQDDYEDDDVEERRPRGKVYDHDDYKAKKTKPITVRTPDGETFTFATKPVSSKVMTRLRAKESSVDDILEAFLTDEGLKSWDDWIEEYDPPMQMVDDIVSDMSKAAGGKGRSKRRRR